MSLDGFAASLWHATVSSLTLLAGSIETAMVAARGAAPSLKRLDRVDVGESGVGRKAAVGDIVQRDGARLGASASAHEISERSPAAEIAQQFQMDGRDTGGRVPARTPPPPRNTSPRPFGTARGAQKHCVAGSSAR